MNTIFTTCFVTSNDADLLNDFLEDLNTQENEGGYSFTFNVQDDLEQAIEDLQKGIDNVSIRVNITFEPDELDDDSITFYDEFINRSIGTGYPSKDSYLYINGYFVETNNNEPSFNRFRVKQNEFYTEAIHGFTKVFDIRQAFFITY
jgi:hypothetical protein